MSRQFFPREGKTGGSDIIVWACEVCSQRIGTNQRADGQAFWVGAIGRSVYEAIQRVMSA